MAPKYKLTYFELTGLAEQIRFLLTFGGIEFEDVRIPASKWPEVKPTTPLGQLPILEVDGKVLFQSVAIDRYLGNLVGLNGDNRLENWEIDAVADTLTDFRIKLMNWRYQEEGPKKEAEKEVLVKETVPFYMDKLEEWASDNNGFLACGKLTWVDLVCTTLLQVFEDYFSEPFGMSFVDDYPNLQKMQNTVLNIPTIKAWVAKRPPNKYPN